MSMKLFFKSDKLKKENLKYVVSERFVENDKPIEWEIKVFNNKELEKIKDSFTKKSFDKGREVYSFDNAGFTKKFITESIVYPNLNDKELQDNYEVMGAYELLQEMLTVPELLSLEDYINKLYDYNNDDIKQVKN